MDLKGREKTPETLSFLFEKRKGVEAFFLPQAVAEAKWVQYSTQSALGEESCPALNPLQCFRAAIIYCSLLCAAEGRRKKKRREQWRERKPAFVQATGKRACVYLCLPEKARIFFPPHLLLGASSLVLRDRSCIWVSFSGRQTATPRLLLMMRADVRLVSMNIDVEDSLFHRRTERGKMAAL